MNRWNAIRRPPVDVLLIDGNPEDARRFRELLEDADVRTDLHVASDGETAREFLSRRGGYADAPRPDVVLLDPLLPDRDGYDLLAELESEPELEPIPKIVLSRSEAAEDVAKSTNCTRTPTFESPTTGPSSTNSSGRWRPSGSVPSSYRPPTGNVSTRISHDVLERRVRVADE